MWQWPTKPEIVPVWSFTEKVANCCLRWNISTLVASSLLYCLLLSADGVHPTSAVPVGIASSTLAIWAPTYRILLTRPIIQKEPTYPWFLAICFCIMLFLSRDRNMHGGVVDVRAEVVVLLENRRQAVRRKGFVSTTKRGDSHCQVNMNPRYLC